MIELLPAGDGGSRLRLTRRPPGEAGDYDPIAEGWRTLLAQLRFALARHPKGEERRTFSRSSPASRADTLPVARPLGLETAARAAPGTRFDAELGPGDAVGGEVWMRSEHQLAVTLDELGDGLLVVWEAPPAAAPPHGAASIVVSAFGAGRGALEELEARWSAWWNVTVGPPAA